MRILVLLLFIGCNGWKGSFGGDPVKETTGTGGGITDAKVIYRNRTDKKLMPYFIEGASGATFDCHDMRRLEDVPPRGEAPITVAANRAAWVRFQTSTVGGGCDSSYNKFEARIFADKHQSSPESVDIN
jgi:hypothetical protein